jgi:hypothetical protein
VWYCYAPDRKGEHPKAHLSNFSGTLQADAYASYEKAYEAARIQEAACWAHVRSRPLLESLRQWFEETMRKLPRKSDTAMAVRYALGRWKALMRYCYDGRLEIDNNTAARPLRVVVLGR